MLEKLSTNIVQKCGGLPLAIVVIGGLLSTKDKSIQEWQKLHDMLHSELESNPHLTSITMILSLSYRDLPYYLKCCFLYFGVFPEDYSIIFSRMIRLWISEGFVKAKQGRTLEEIAEGYIAELSQRNMIQTYWGYSGVMKCCKVHDLMRETIFPLIGKLSYCQVLDAEKECYPSLNREVRRLSVHNNIGNILKKERVAVRSFFVFSTNHELDKALMDTLFESFTLLKVLDLEDCPYVSYLPENVGNLLHLRYLCVNSKEIKNLPKSIGKLFNLETLDLVSTQVKELPMEIYRLRKLRHLLCGWFDSEIEYGLDSRRGVKIHKGIGELKELQTLAGVEASEDWIEELMKLTQLRVFDLTNVTAKMGTTLCNAIKNMNNLKTLDVNLKNDQCELLDFESIPIPPPFLWNLCFRGRLKKLPFSTNPSTLQNVVTIRLFLSRLTEDPLKALQALPNLMHLDVSYEAYRGERLHIEEGWFQKLQVLTLKRLEKLRTLTIENGALPLLRKLVIGPQNMKELPHDIIFLRNLEKLAIREMPREFVLRILPEGGEDYWKLEHIPVVRVHFKIRGNYFQSFKLGDSGLLDHLQIS